MGGAGFSVCDGNAAMAAFVGWHISKKRSLQTNPINQRKMPMSDPYQRTAAEKKKSIDTEGSECFDS